MENVTFTHVCSANANRFKQLYKLYPPYKIKTLKHHGESPCGKKTFKQLLDNTIENAATDELDNVNRHFVVMCLGRIIIGFAVFSTCVNNEPVELPFKYGSVGDYFVAPELRRKGYGRKLNDYIESVFIENGTQFVLLTPDPVTGEKFWKAVGYADTGLNKGYNRYWVYMKCLTVFDKTDEIDLAIRSKISRIDIVHVNIYNKKQIRELGKIWLPYCIEKATRNGKKANNCGKIKIKLKKSVKQARNIPKLHFYALYFEGKIIGFAFFGITDGIKSFCIPEDCGKITDFYIAPEFRRKGFATKMNCCIENIFRRDGITNVLLAPGPIIGVQFFKSVGYVDAGIIDADAKLPVYTKKLENVR